MVIVLRRVVDERPGVTKASMVDARVVEAWKTDGGAT